MFIIFQQTRNLLFNLYKLRNHYIVCTDLRLKHQVSYKWKMMYMLNFLLRCLSYNIDDIHMDNEYTYITRSIKVMYNMLYMI